MILELSNDGALKLDDAENFGSFHISAERKLLNVSFEFSKIGNDAGDRHFWLNADAIIELSGKSNDVKWNKSFWAMLTKVEKFGYSDVENRFIKAHVESPVAS